MINPKIIVILLLQLLIIPTVYGQCCSAGNPVGGDGSYDGLPAKQWRLFAGFRQSYSRDYFHLSKKEDMQHIDHSVYNYSSISVSYGILKNTTLHTEFGYFFDKTQVVNLQDGKEKITAGGPGDLSLNVRQRLFQQKLPNSAQFVAMFGTRLPVGAFHEQSRGVTIPISLQPSSGALKLNAGIFYSKKKKGNLLGYSSVLFFEWSNAIDKDLLYYKYGSFFSVEATGIYSRTSKFTALLSGKLECRDNDRREDNIEISSTGSKVIYVKPQIHYQLHAGLFLIASTEFPVYKYVNGYQLTNLYAFQVGVMKTFTGAK